MIYCLYKKLARLELEGKYNSEEFKKTVKLINKIKISETNYYQFLSTLGDEKYILSYNVIAKKEALGDVSTKKKPLNDVSYLFSPKADANDIIAMRISSKITDIFRHMYHKDPATLNVYDTYEPLKDKYFLDILDSQIDDEEYFKYKKLLVNAKYDYAFVFDKDIKELREYDEELEDNQNIDLVVGIGSIMEYKEKFQKLDTKTLLNPKNMKRLILDINYIRACALSIPEENIEMIKIVTLNENPNPSEGLNVFLNILNMAIEDKNNFDEGDIPYKRKF
jgi:hypothetical protein